MSWDNGALLERARQGEETACEDLLITNEGLIWSIVRRYCGRGVEADDLYQLGCVGFIKAVKGFDPNFGCQFSTYAVPKIAGEIRRFLRDDGAVKISRTVKEHAVAIRTVRERMLHSLGREPTLSELAEESGLSVEEIVTADTALTGVTSLQSETGEDGLTLEGVLSGEGSMEEDVVERVTLRHAIDQLSQREREVIFLRYYKDMTQEQAARILGVSQVQVSRIEKKAVSGLKEILVREI